MRLVNELPEPTSVHWHGVRLPNAMDGVPQLTQPPVAPGASFDYRFRPPDAGTFWYHAPVRGAARARLPRRADRRGARTGARRSRCRARARQRPVRKAAPFPPCSSMALPFPLSQSEPATVAPAADQCHRCPRARARVDGHAPWVMAIDGQPAEPFLARDGRVGLGPGSRVDLFVDTMQDAGTVAQIVAARIAAEPIARLSYAAGQRRAHARDRSRGRSRPIRCRHASTSRARSRSRWRLQLPSRSSPAAAALRRQARARGDIGGPQYQRAVASHPCARPLFPPARPA